MRRQFPARRGAGAPVLTPAAARRAPGRPAPAARSREAAKLGSLRLLLRRVMPPAAVIHFEQRAVVGIAKGDALAVQVAGRVRAAVTQRSNVIGRIILVPIVQLADSPGIALFGKLFKFVAAVAVSALWVADGGGGSVHRVRSSFPDRTAPIYSRALTSMRTKLRCVPDPACHPPGTSRPENRGMA